VVACRTLCYADDMLLLLSAAQSPYQLLQLFSLVLDHQRLQAALEVLGSETLGPAAETAAAQSSVDS